MAAGTSLICDTTILSDCSYRFFFMGFVFLARLVQFLFLLIALLESMFASKLAGNMIHLSLTSLSKSKFSVIPYVSCFLEIIQRFSIFVMYQSMVADRSSI